MEEEKKKEKIIDQPVDALKRKDKADRLPTKQEITSVLTAVEDPELHINIIDLGLVYKIDRDESKGTVSIDMTLTSPACPYGPQLLGQTHAIVGRLPGVKEVKINPVWTPHWDPRVHASESAQMMLGII
jgi:metal-sulfur cluster biosynthetic enzyme